MISSASAISGNSGVGEKPASAGARTAWASASRPPGAPVDEIEITSEMIEAGIEAVDDADPVIQPATRLHSPSGNVSLGSISEAAGQPVPERAEPRLTEDQEPGFLQDVTAVPRDGLDNRMNRRRLLQAMSALPFIGSLFSAAASSELARPFRASVRATRAGRPTKPGRNSDVGWKVG